MLPLALLESDEYPLANLTSFGGDVLLLELVKLYIPSAEVTLIPGATAVRIVDGDRTGSLFLDGSYLVYMTADGRYEAGFPHHSHDGTFGGLISATAEVLAELGFIQLPG